MKTIIIIQSLSAACNYNNGKQYVTCYGGFSKGPLVFFLTHDQKATFLNLVRAFYSRLTPGYKSQFSALLLSGLSFLPVFILDP